MISALLKLKADMTSEHAGCSGYKNVIHDRALDRIA